MSETAVPPSSRLGRSSLTSWSAPGWRERSQPEAEPMSGYLLQRLRRTLDAEETRTPIGLVDAAILDVLRRLAPGLLRISLGVVFVWFGALKVLGVTPVTDLVAGTVSWADPGWFIPALGTLEVLIGSGLILATRLRLVLVLFTGQMVGTFLVFLVQPDVAFVGGNPLLLTVEGEFVVKNIVLLSAGLTVASHLTAQPDRAAPSAPIVTPPPVEPSVEPASLARVLSSHPTSSARSSARTGPMTRPRPLAEARAQALAPPTFSRPSRTAGDGHAFTATLMAAATRARLDDGLSVSADGELGTSLDTPRPSTTGSP